MSQTIQPTTPDKRSDGQFELLEQLNPKKNWNHLLQLRGAKLSAVIPFYNEEGNLTPLYDRLKPVLESIAPNHEIIFVNDGSGDRSPQEAASLAAKDPTVTLLHFKNNFGKANALSAGFMRANGDLILMMDADLQDQPEEAHKLISRLGEGFDLVTGWKRVRHDPKHKTWPSKLFNRTVSRAFNLQIHDFNCGFKVMVASIAKEIRLYGDYHRFIPALAADMGYSVAECAVEHAPRTIGVSKYGGKRLVTGLLDFLGALVVSKHFHKATQFFGRMALKLFTCGALLIVLLAGWRSSAGPLWILSCSLVLAGLQILMTGLVGEMVVNVLRRTSTLAENAEPIVIQRTQEVVLTLVHGPTPEQDGRVPVAVSA